VYENPEEFIPERWENQKTVGYSYLPFSLGSRICVGNNFSLNEQKMFLATLLQKLKFSFVNSNEIVAEELSALLLTPQKRQIKFEKI
jgi:cytochrome P450